MDLKIEKICPSFICEKFMPRFFFFKFLKLLISLIKNHYMQFRFEFSGAEIVEERRRIQIHSNSFRFITDFKVYEIDIFMAALFSKKVERLIQSNQLCTEYRICESNYSEEFLDNFFDSILENCFTVDANSLKSFIALIVELDFQKIKNSMNATILSYLCDTISPGQSLPRDEDKYNFLCNNFRNIDLGLLKKMPDNIILKIVSEAQFDCEDDRANFIIYDNFFGINYISCIKFEDLSLEVYRKVISRIQQDPERSKLIENFIRRGISEADKRKEIKILNVNAPNSIDFKFLEALNTKNDIYKVIVTAINYTDFVNQLQNNNDYMNDYDIFMFGGCDYFYNAVRTIENTVFQRISAFRQQGGTVLILHDVIQTAFKPLHRLLEAADRYKNNGEFTEIQLSEKSDKIDIISTPFYVGKNIHVATTHQVVVFDPKYVVLHRADPTNKDVYYAENLQENIGECSIGHELAINEQEQKLVYNIICHLFNINQFLKKTGDL